MFKNIGLIAKEEYLNRVTKKSFIILTLLAPLLFAGFYAVVIGIAVNETKSKDEKKVLILDKDNLLNNELESDDYYSFSFVSNKTEAFQSVEDETCFGVLELYSRPNLEKDSMELISLDYPSIKTKEDIKKRARMRIGQVNLIKLGISQSSIDSAKRRLILESKVLNADEIEESSSELRAGIGFALAMVIYMFIFIYGVQVMKGVNEEKTNRIVEIIISTVKPFDLMMGKILGIAGVGLTQFLAWIGLTSILSLIVGAAFASGMDVSTFGGSTDIAQTGGGVMTEVFHSVSNLPFGAIISGFIFYFLGGYLIYASLFAAVAAAVDSDTDYQQFMMPITIPLIFAIVIAQMVVFNNPDSTLAVITSIVPLTSPIVMMVRIPFGVDTWQVLASFVSLIGFFLLTVWAAGKIYKTGILMFGQKASYKMLIKWVFSRK